MQSPFFTQNIAHPLFLIWVLHLGMLGGADIKPKGREQLLSSERNPAFEHQTSKKSPAAHPFFVI